MRPSLALLLTLLLLALLVFVPEIDRAVAGWFYRPVSKFFLGDYTLFNSLHSIAYTGARLLGATLLVLAIATLILCKTLLGLGTKAWLFLFLGLLLGPALIANGILKDHWGRARPRETVEFGGASQFTPALIPAQQCAHNCSFVSGDGAFGFYLPVFAYMVPPSRSRRVFWSGMGLAFLFSFARLAAGAHFLSDTLFAALSVQGSVAILHGFMYGWAQTIKCWRYWLFYRSESNG